MVNMKIDESPILFLIRVHMEWQVVKKEKYGLHSIKQTLSAV